MQILCNGDGALVVTALQRHVQTPAPMPTSCTDSGLVVGTGKLTVDASADSGFDIYSVVSGGSITDQMAFATLPVGGQHGLLAGLKKRMQARILAEAVPFNRTTPSRQ